MNTKILVVDDEQIIRILLSSLLFNLGYDAVISENGEQAINIYEQCTSDIDIAIIDLIMPGMNGYETYEKLKSIDPKIKVIFSSGQVDDHFSQLIQTQPGCAFLAKPYKMDQLSRILEELRERSKIGIDKF